MINRLRKKFIRIAAASVALVMILLTIAVNLGYYLYSDKELSNMLIFIHENQGMIPMQHREKEPPDRRPGGFTQETPFSTRYFVLRFSETGGILNSDFSHIAEVTSEDTSKFVEIAMKNGEGFGRLNEYKYYVTSLPAGAYEAIFLNRSFERRSARMLAIMSLLADVICIILVYVLVVLMSRRAIEPVVKNVRQQKQFITDASHELKTPLTVMTTSLKVLEMEVGNHKWIDKAERQTEKMTELVNSLVTLSRMDEEEPSAKMKNFNISEAVMEEVSSFEEPAGAEGHKLMTDIKLDLNCCGDEGMIRQLVSILMDNAMKYSLPETEISFTLEKEHRNIVIKCCNYCDKIEENELGKLFDRFYRVDKSRASGDSGFGVGLSIARSIAEIHHGTIKAISPEDGKIEFKVCIKS